MTTLYGIRNCDTVKKARTWLDAHGVAYDIHDYKTAGIDAARLSDWADRAGWEALLNRVSTTFRKLSDQEKAGIDRERAIALMVEHPTLIKRPVVEREGALLVGFKPETWAATFAR